MSHPNYNDYRSLFPSERPVSTPPLATFAGGGGVILISAGVSSNIGTAFSFSDDNNVSFGISNGSITASASYLAQTVQTQGLVTVQGSTGAIVFSNSNGVTFGGNNSTITASFSQSNQPVYFSASGGVSSVDTLSFINSNGVTFSNSNGSIIASIFVPSGAFRVSAGTATSDLTNIVFSNSNGVTFGLNGATVTATVATNYLTTQSNQTIGAYGVGNTTQGSSGTLDVRSLSLRGGGIVSVGYSNGSIIVSASAAGVADGYNIIAAGTQTANTTGTVKFSNSGGVTFGMNNSSIVTATVATNYMASNRGSDFVQATAVFAGTNASGTIASGGISVSVAAQSAVPQNASLYALGNTTQNSSTVLSVNALSFKATGSLTIGYSNGTIQFSAPNALTSQTVQTQNNIAGIIASDTTYGTGTISFKDGNGLSWGSETGQGISLTHGLQYTSATSAITSNAVNTSAARIQGIAASNTTYTSGSVTFRDLNGISWQSTTGQQIQITHALQFTSATSAITANAINTSQSSLFQHTSATSAITSNALNTSASRVINIIAATNSTGGGTASLSSNVSFSNANNFTFYTSAGNAIVGSFSQSVDTLKAGTGFTSAGNNIGLSGTLNTNGLSLSATVAAQTNQSIGLYASSNTTLTSSGTIDARSFSVRGIGAASIGFSASEMLVSVPVQSLQTQSRFNMTLSGNSTSAGGGYILVSSGVLTLAGGNNITLSQDGNALTISGANAGGVQTGISGIAASNATYTSGSVTFRDGNGITWASTTGQQISITHGLQYSSQMTDYQSTGAYLTTAAQSTQTFLASLGGNTGTTNSSRIGNGGFVFAGGNGVTINQSNNSVSWSVETAYQSQGAYLTTAAQSTQTLMISLGGNTGTTNSSRISNGGYVLAGGNGVTLNQSNNSLSISVETAYQSQGAYLTTAALSNHSHGNPTLALTNLTGTTASASNGFTLSLSGPTAGLTTAAQSTQTLGFTLGGNVATTNSSQIAAGGYILAGGNGVTIQQSNNTVSLSVATAYQSQGAYLTTARASTDAIGLNTAQSNVTWTANSSGLSLDARGYAGTGTTFNGANISGSITQNSVGVQLSLSVAAPGAAAENNWINLLGANTAGNTTASGSTIGFSGINLTLSGTNNSAINISAPATSSLSGTGQVSISVNGSTISIGVPNPYISSFCNMPDGLVNSSALTWNAASISHAVAFNLPQQGSFSFVRIPGLMTTNSTTIATMASATASAQGALYSTINAVVYSLGTGASSKSLQWITSGVGNYTMSQKISVSNSTQASYSLGVTAEVEGQVGRTSLTTQYSVSNTNYSFTTNQIATNFSSARFLDLQFPASLSAGPYWMIIGMSSSSSSAGAAGLAALTNCNVRYSAHYGASQAVLSMAPMGSTNLTSGGLMGAGSFSTAGGGTTNSLDISAISSMASLAMMYFQLLRSA